MITVLFILRAAFFLAVINLSFAGRGHNNTRRWIVDWRWKIRGFLSFRLHELEAVGQSVEYVSSIRKRHLRHNQQSAESDCSLPHTSTSLQLTPQADRDRVSGQSPCRSAGEHRSRNHGLLHCGVIRGRSRRAAVLLLCGARRRPSPGLRGLCRGAVDLPREPLLRVACDWILISYGPLAGWSAHSFWRGSLFEPNTIVCAFILRGLAHR